MKMRFGKVALGMPVPSRVQGAHRSKLMYSALNIEELSLLLVELRLELHKNLASGAEQEMLATERAMELQTIMRPRGVYM